MTKTSMKWFACCGKNAYWVIFTSTFVHKKIFCIWMEKTCSIQKWLKLFRNLLRSMKKTVTSCEKTSANWRTFFSMSIQMCTLRSIVQLNGEVSTLELHFTLFLKLKKTKKSLNNRVKIHKKHHWKKWIVCFWTKSRRNWHF